MYQSNVDVLVHSVPRRPQSLHLLPRLPVQVRPLLLLLHLLHFIHPLVALLPLLRSSWGRLVAIYPATCLWEKVAEWVGGGGKDCGLRDAFVVVVVVVVDAMGVVVVFMGGFGGEGCRAGWGG